MKQLVILAKLHLKVKQVLPLTSSNFIYLQPLISKTPKFIAVETERIIEFFDYEDKDQLRADIAPSLNTFSIHKPKLTSSSSNIVKNVKAANDKIKITTLEKRKQIKENELFAVSFIIYPVSKINSGLTNILQTSTIFSIKKLF